MVVTVLNIRYLSFLSDAEDPAAECARVHAALDAWGGAIFPSLPFSLSPPFAACLLPTVPLSSRDLSTAFPLPFRCLLAAVP